MLRGSIPSSKISETEKERKVFNRIKTFLLPNYKVTLPTFVTSFTTEKKQHSYLIRNEELITCAIQKLNTELVTKTSVKSD